MFSIEPQIEQDINIVYMQHRDATVLEAGILLDGHLFTGRGASKRAPGDPYNEEVGYGLALGRALLELGDRIQKGLKT